MTPLTLDGGAIELYLDGLDPDLVSEGGTELAPMLAQGRQLLTATSDGADRVLVVFTDGELHDSLGAAVAEAKTSWPARESTWCWWRRGHDPGRGFPVRDATGALVEYQKDQDGHRASRLPATTGSSRPLADAAEGTVVAAALPDQAGAVRDLLAGVQAQRPDRRPPARLSCHGPGSRCSRPLAAPGLAAVHPAHRRRCIGLALILVGAGSASAQRPSDAERAYRKGRAAEAWRALPGARPSAASPRIPPTSTPEPRPSRPAKSRTPARRSRRPPAHAIPALRYRALYNLGLLNLLSRSRRPGPAGSELQAAAQYLQDALLLEPGLGPRQVESRAGPSRIRRPRRRLAGARVRRRRRGRQSTAPASEAVRSLPVPGRADPQLGGARGGVDAGPHTARTRVGSPRIKDW